MSVQFHLRRENNSNVSKGGPVKLDGVSPVDRRPFPMQLQYTQSKTTLLIMVNLRRKVQVPLRVRLPFWSWSISGVMSWEEVGDLLAQSITEVFVEQPLATPGSAKKEPVIELNIWFVQLFIFVQPCWGLQHFLFCPLYV